LAGQTFHLKVRDDLNRRIEILEIPQRIVSLGPSITEELYLLGVDDKIVGTTIYCNHPPMAKKKEKVGTVIKVNLERILCLKL